MNRAKAVLPVPAIRSAAVESVRSLDGSVSCFIAGKISENDSGQERTSFSVLDKNQSIDVLFIDLALGGDLEAGLKVAQYARVNRPKLAVIYTTGAAVNAGMQALFTDPYLFLPKPYTIEQLTKSVSYLLLKVSPRPKIEFPKMPN